MKKIFSKFSSMRPLFWSQHCLEGAKEGIQRLESLVLPSTPWALHALVGARELWLCPLQALWEGLSLFVFLPLAALLRLAELTVFPSGETDTTETKKAIWGDVCAPSDTAEQRGNADSTHAPQAVCAF